MKLLILHLSDMHFAADKNYDRNKVTAIVNALNSHSQGIAHILCVVSGDLMYSGKSNESRRVYRFFQDLKAGIVDRYHIQDIRFFDGSWQS